MLASIGVQLGEEGDIYISGKTALGIKLKKGETNETMMLFPKVGINSHTLNQGVWSQSIKCYQLAVQLVNERC